MGRQTQNAPIAQWLSNNVRVLLVTQDRAAFLVFVEDKLTGPLETLSPLGIGGVGLFADIYAGEDLK